VRASRRSLAAAAVAALLVAACDEAPPTAPEEDGDEVLSGGETTIFNATSQAFTFPAPNVGDLDRHLEGDLAFDAAFVAPPAPVNPGLGPVFNNTACAACHVSNGRGRPPYPGEDLESMLFRVSVPGADAEGGPAPVPGFGGQLNDKALFGVEPEARVAVTYSETAGEFPDGEPYSLRTPSYTLEDPYQPLPGGVMLSPRVALPVFGRGLLEAVPEDDLLALADDLAGDGVSGRPNYVRDRATQSVRFGRFGWKAGQPTLLQQAAAAYRNDMGVTNPIFPTESAEGQPQDDGRGDEPEIDLATVEVAAFYTQTLAVPARRDVDDPEVRRGRALFEEIRCAACHVPTLRTGTLPGVPSVSNQTIHPYTDLMLHDMGEGLADGRPEFLATGREWRTPPLWGIGLTRIVHGEVHLLHDGRARTLTEAILWHGGEAEASRERFRALPRAERDALRAFLESL
jgi:CxxC motif-containing protein (DUF1111 family)